MATRLRRLLLREISLVKRGANPGARVLVFKSGDTMSKGLAGVMGSLRTAFQAVTGQAADGTELKTQDEVMARVDKSLEEFATSLVDAEEPTPAVINTTVIKQEPPVTTAAAEPKPEDVIKSLPEAAQAVIRKAQETATAAEARASAAEAEVLKSKDAQAQTVRIEKAESMLGGKLAGDKTKLAEILKALTPEQITVLEEVFKGAVEQLKTQVVTEEIGKGGKAGTDAKAQLIAKSAEVRKVRPELSPSQAEAEVLKANPELYEASLTKGA